MSYASIERDSIPMYGISHDPCLMERSVHRMSQNCLPLSAVTLLNMTKNTRCDGGLTFGSWVRGKLIRKCDKLQGILERNAFIRYARRAECLTEDSLQPF